MEVSDSVSTAVDSIADFNPPADTSSDAIDSRIDIAIDVNQSLICNNNTESTADSPSSTCSSAMLVDDNNSQCQLQVQNDCSISKDTADATAEENALLEEAAKVSMKYKLYDIPNININNLSKDFLLDEYDVEVTSLDITSHGFFVLAGCGNGMVLLFDMTSPNSRGVIVGYIQAKGLHTNLLLQVQITDDCRFCFAGVQKGSSEMLAIDLGRLQPASALKKATLDKHNLLDWITTHSYSDAKLRGFCASTRFVSGRNSSLCFPKSKGVNDHNPMLEPLTYRLACGRGIKNVHVWQFEPDIFIRQENGDMIRQPKWTCIYDVASNGNTIESIAFRDYGNQVISKSAGVVLRLWDLKKADDAIEANLKPAYEDIPNSADVKRLFDKYSFGGTYEFAVVNISAPKIANRDSYEMPERTTEDENGQRRRRMMRQIEDVVGTSDGQHVLALCTDGGVMYFNRNEENQSPEIMEFGSVRDPEVDSGWAIKRVGIHGEVVLLRAIKASKSTTIRINPLFENMTAESKTRFASTGVKVPSTTNYYFEFDNSLELIDGPAGAALDDAALDHSVTDASAKKTPSRSRKSASLDVKSTPAASSSERASFGSSSKLERERERSIEPSSAKKDRHGDKSDTNFITPAHAVASSAVHNKVTPSDIIDRFADMNDPNSPILKRKRVKPISNKDKDVEITEMSVTMPANSTVTRDNETPSKKKSKEAKANKESTVAFSAVIEQPEVDENTSASNKSFVPKKLLASFELNIPVVGPPPQVARVIESNEVVPLPELSSFAKRLWSSYQSLASSFISDQSVVSTSDESICLVDQSNSSSLGDRNLPLGVFSLQQLSVIGAEQLALRSRFIYDFEQCLAFHACGQILALEKQIANSNSSERLFKNIAYDGSKDVDFVIRNYRSAVYDLICKQQMDMKIAWDMDVFHSQFSSPPAHYLPKSSNFKHQSHFGTRKGSMTCPLVVFQFEDLFENAFAFIDEVKDLFLSNIIDNSSSSASVDGAEMDYQKDSVITSTNSKDEVMCS